MTALNRDPFWYIINPEQHVQVIDQERLDYIWRAQQTAWHDLLDRLHLWGAIVKFEPGTRNVTRKSAQAALRRVLPHNSRNVLDAHMTRLQALGILRRLDNGLYRVSFVHAGAAVLWCGQAIPEFLREGTDESREQALLHGARDFAKTVEDTEELPNPASLPVKPFVPNKGGQGRMTPAYQAAFDLWQFCIHNARLWEEVVGIHWTAPALGRTAGIKEWVREHGTRRGSDALQEFIDLGRACGLFRPTQDRTQDQAMPSFAPVVNRLMWELLPGNTTSVAEAAHVAEEIRGAFQKGFSTGDSVPIAEAWRAHAQWKYVPSSSPPPDNRPGTYIRWPSEDDLEDMANPLPSALGMAATPGKPTPMSHNDGVWWEQLIGRAEKILADRPDWRLGAILPLPARLPVKLELPGVRREPDPNATLAELGVAIAKFDVQCIAVAVLLPRWDMPGRAQDGPPHRVELSIVTPTKLERFTGDMKTINGRAEPQRWLPLPPNEDEDIPVEAIRATMDILSSPESRRQAREDLADLLTRRAPAP